MWALGKTDGWAFGSPKIARMRPPPCAGVGQTSDNALGSYALCLASQAFGSGASFSPRIGLTRIPQLVTPILGTRALLAPTSTTSPHIVKPFVISEPLVIFFLASHRPCYSPTRSRPQGKARGGRPMSMRSGPAMPERTPTPRGRRPSSRHPPPRDGAAAAHGRALGSCTA